MRLEERSMAGSFCAPIFCPIFKGTSAFCWRFGSAHSWSVRITWQPSLNHFRVQHLKNQDYEKIKYINVSSEAATE